MNNAEESERIEMNCTQLNVFTNISQSLTENSTERSTQRSIAGSFPVEVNHLVSDRKSIPKCHHHHLLNLIPHSGM